MERSDCGYDLAKDHLNKIIKTIDLGALKFNCFLNYIFNKIKSNDKYNLVQCQITVNGNSVGSSSVKSLDLTYAVISDGKRIISHIIGESHTTIFLCIRSFVLTRMDSHGCLGVDISHGDIRANSHIGPTSGAHVIHPTAYTTPPSRPNNPTMNVMRPNFFTIIRMGLTIGLEKKQCLLKSLNLRPMDVQSMSFDLLHDS